MTLLVTVSIFFYFLRDLSLVFPWLLLSRSAGIIRASYRTSWVREAMSDVSLASGNFWTTKMAALSEYENAMFLELMDDDGLFVTAK